MGTSGGAVRRSERMLYAVIVFCFTRSMPLPDFQGTHFTFLLI